MKREIIICGGSLAGLAAAIHLKQLGFQPLVIEKATFPRGKLCGEFLGPDAFPVLSQLGLLSRVLKASQVKVETVTFYNQRQQELHIPLRWMSRAYPFGAAIPRAQLDWILLDYARSLSVEVVEDAKVLSPLQARPDGFEVRALHQHKMVHYSGGVVLDASGRSSGIHAEKESLLYVNSASVGLQCHVEISSIRDSKLRMFLFPGGYGGIQPVYSGVANLCLLLQGKLQPGKLQAVDPFDFRTVMKQTMALNPSAEAILKDAQPLEKFQATANLNYFPRRGQLIRIGDAHLNVDPITGSGMAHALETGYLAAEVVAQGFQSKKSYTEIRRMYLARYERKYGLRLRFLRGFRPLLFSGRLQEMAWPGLRMLAPGLAYLMR